MYRGQVLFSSGSDIHELDPATGATAEWRRCAAGVTALAVLDETLAIGLSDGSLILSDKTDRIIKTGDPCITAISPGGKVRLIVCIGSTRNSAADWKRDLLQGGVTGQIWALPLADGTMQKIAGGLAWPCGAAMAAGQLVVVEAWRHRLMQISAEPQVTDLPGYPSRLSAAPDGWWLTVFAPRNQLIELVLRERDYRDRMMREVEPDHWIAPNPVTRGGFQRAHAGGSHSHAWHHQALGTVTVLWVAGAA